jgi:AraC-like DNA-binding protein
MDENIPQFAVYLVSFLFLSFASFLLVTRKKNNVSNEMLAILFICLGLSVIDVSNLITGFYAENPAYAFWLEWIPYVYGPCIFLFTKSVLFKDFKFKSWQWLHFLFPILVFIYYLFTYHINSPSPKITLYKSLKNDGHLFNSSLFPLVSIIVYLILAFLNYQKYSKGIKNQFSNIEKISLGWVRHVILGFVGLLLVSFIIQSISMFVDNINLIRTLSLFSLFTLFVFIISSIFRGLKYSANFDGINEQELEIIQDIKKPNLSSEDQSILAEIDNKVQEGKLFLNPDISLKELAENLGIPARKLSILLNQGLNKNFFDYINNYRILTAMEMIEKSEDEKITILEIMYKAGFNSKSSFNTAFKKFTGMTPTQFKKEPK